ncbi:MAG: ABC transporter ATP-binding protein [Bacilli bacterium]|nr:ABC transporter ATP-binding protein [Bacilli bacterium]
MIEIRNLSFNYEDSEETLKNINLSINKHEKVSIIGKSGCGKTTLLLLLAGIYKPTSGEIYINDKLLTNVRKETGIIFQSGGLFPWKTVYQNLSLAIKSNNSNITKTEMNEKIDNVLRELDIYEHKHKYLKELSGGQIQRVAIERILVMNVDLLLMDEPSSSLDALTKDAFQNTMLELYKKHDLTSIIITHDIEEAVYLGQKIIVMKDGYIHSIIDNEFYGDKDAKKTIQFYEKCIEVRKHLE